MSKRFVSILVPAHNAAPYLSALCASIQAQTHGHFELLIANDGSTDNTLEVLEPFRSDRRFQILSWKKNRGVTQATLALLNLMRGEYWCHPGADDLLNPNFLERRIASLDANPQALMAHGAAEFIDATGKKISNLPIPGNLPMQMDGQRALGALLQHNFINTPSVMIRSNLTKLVLPFFGGNWKYAQDWYLWLLHFATGFDLLWDPEPLHKYRIHAASLSNSPEKEAIRNAEIRLVPLCALSVAARFSQIAAVYWRKWRSSLYALWLRRAFRIRSEKALLDNWSPMAAYAFYGTTNRGFSLHSEGLRHAASILKVSSREKRALTSQSFRVSGLAQINDPIFR
jgi:glycosyltransferase involved in cell wall biosynthesis